jgi:hypothetical protein
MGRRVIVHGLLPNAAWRFYFIPGGKLDLTDEQTTTLLSELDRIIDGDRFPLSPRILTLKDIRAMMRPGSTREPLPPPFRHTHAVHRYRSGCCRAIARIRSTD